MLCDINHTEGALLSPASKKNKFDSSVPPVQSTSESDSQTKGRKIRNWGEGYRYMATLLAVFCSHYQCNCNFAETLSVE